MSSGDVAAEYTHAQIARIKSAIMKKWVDPVARAESIFRIQTGTGHLVDLKIPEPQKPILRAGLVGSARRLVKNGERYNRVTNKGRQAGYSILEAVETILAAEDYPKTYQYYIATKGEQSESWLRKVDQLIRDAKHWPPELGGGPILHFTENGIRKTMSKEVNGCTIYGLTANPAGLRGDTAIKVVLDEYAWMLRIKNQQKEVYTAIKHFLRQGGQLSILSTPRTKTDEFWRFVEHGPDLGFDVFECPIIENWEDLAIEKPLFIDFNNRRRKDMGMVELSDKDKDALLEKYLPQKYVYDEELEGLRQDPIIIPYPWVSLPMLEQDRKEDLEMFKQENLGIPVDERYKVILGEWVYPHAQEYNPNTGEGTDWPHRRDSHNPFGIGIDFAQIKDLTIITIVEKIGDHYYERLVRTTQAKYDEQERLILELYEAFKPQWIAIDNTGAGIPIGDHLEKRLPAGVLRRVNFTNSSKEEMATTLKRVFQAGEYHVLDHTPDHKTSIRHLLKVERQVMENSVKYTGKGVDKEGRDDGFWSKALAVRPVDNTAEARPMAVAAHRRVAPRADTGGSRLYAEIQRERDKQARTKREVAELAEQERDGVPGVSEDRARRLKQVFSAGMRICSKTNKPVKVHECVCAGQPQCRYYNQNKIACERLGFTQEEAEEILRQ